jgi:GT2 family glycosyltransferase
MSISLSIIIPTFHRKNSVLRLLGNLASQKIANQIIVVEQTQRNEGVIRAYAKAHKLNLQYIFLPAPSTAHAMNVGVQAAKGEYVLFLDDDVVVKPGIIENHLKNFDDPKVAATVGRVITPGQKNEIDRRDVGRVNWLGVHSDGYSSTIRQEVDSVIGCNTCWRTDIYRKLGGIDEQFTGNAMRLESDLSLRARKAGYTIMFEPKAVVEHLREETGGARKTEGRMAWNFDFFSNETYFFLKHRPHILLPLFLLTKTEWALRCMFGFGREVSIRSMATPLRGVLDGIRKYKNYENRH